MTNTANIINNELILPIQFNPPTIFKIQDQIKEILSYEIADQYIRTKDIIETERLDENEKKSLLNYIQFLETFINFNENENESSEVKILTNSIRSYQSSNGNYINIDFINKDNKDTTPAHAHQTSSFKISIYSMSTYEDAIPNELEKLNTENIIRMLELIEIIFNFTKYQHLLFNEKIVTNHDKFSNSTIYNNPELDNSEIIISGSIDLNISFNSQKYRSIGEYKANEVLNTANKLQYLSKLTI